MKIRLHVPIFLSLLTLVGFTASKADAALLIGNSDSDTIVVFDESTGTFQGNFIAPGLGGLRSPDDLTIGPDGNLYVSSGGNSGGNIFAPAYPQDSAVLRYSLTGEFLGVAASGGGLARPYGNAFAPDGSLFVSSFRTNQILRYDGTTGAFLGVFASDNNGGLGTVNGLNGPNGLLFAPDGSLYVTTEGTVNTATGDLSFLYASQVLRYSPEQVAGLASTATPGVFADQPALLPESPGFISLLGLALAPTEDSLYVSDFAGGIRQYDLAGNLLSVLSTNYTGTLPGTPGSNFVGSLTFGTGANSADLYAIGFDTANQNTGSVLAYSNAQGSADTFSGSLFTSSSLERPIGVVAAAGVPEPSTVAGLVLGLGGLGIARLRRRRLPE